MISCGIDEAGRGPVIGPLVLAAVVVDDSGLARLKKLNVRDSKKISAGRRGELEPEIKKLALEYKIIKISPSDIDRLRKKMSLNVLEADKMAELILSLVTVPEKVYVDSADNVPEDFREKIVSYINRLHPDYKIPEIISENKADDKYLEVGAASVLAKVERDRVIEHLVREHGDLGSGYPSDEVTQKFIKKLIKDGELPHYVRRSWNTVDKAKQSKLEDF